MEKIDKLIEKKAKQMGIKKSTYCFNIIFEQLKKDEGLEGD